jgi:hypothetical protein
VESAQGQVLLAILLADEPCSEKLEFGFKLHRAFRTLTGVEGANDRRGRAFGAFGEINLSDQWNLQPELSMTAPAGAQGFPGSPGEKMTSTRFSKTPWSHERCPTRTFPLP